MSKRRINKQQKLRIEKNQNAYQDMSQEALDTLAEGLVIARYSKQVDIENQEGKLIRCSIRPHLDTLVAGDKVKWLQVDSEHGVVVSLSPRTSVLARPTSTGLKKPVAANITQLIIVIAPKPEIAWPLLDSYLIMAQTLKLDAILVMNKTDLLSDELKTEFLNDYQALGYPIVFTTHHKTLESLNTLLNHQVSVFIGQSGVGKSSLISKLLPHETNIATQSLSEHSELGQHTTSNSRYYHLPKGGALIDSPGVREFSLWEMDAIAIAKGYKEFMPYLPQCRFRNCLHVDTPGCAIIDGVNQGIISKKRYDNFVKLCSKTL